jgi:hypothetical protein
VTVVATTNPVTLLADRLAEFGATELLRETSTIRVSIPVPLSDGRQPVFILDLSVSGTAASAREITPTHLPAFCPDRHINDDGSFCLYWRAVDGIEIDCTEAARAWLETLVRFLQLQFRAARLRRWPDGRARAHGSAVVHQHRAEAAAARLGEPFTKDMAEGALTVVRKAGSAEGTALRVMKGRRRLFAVWERSRRAVNQRGPCLCPAGSGIRPRVLKSCGNHSLAAADLAMELNAMALAEKRFWKAAKGSPCCGSMDSCPLAEM